METKLKATPREMIITRNIKAVLGPEGNAISDDSMFLVEIKDDGGGEYVSICQPPDYNELLINPNEWPALKKLVDKMVKQCMA